jgi:TRAP-type mannitol/chloroaromatic compound transport system permease small subunit
MGLAILLLTGLLASLSNTHFDGVLDTHTGARVPLWFFLSEGIIDWLCMAIVLLVCGTLVSRTAFRMVDVFGTQALARWPAIFVSLATLPAGYQRFTHYLVELFLKPGAKTEFNAADAVIFGAAILVMIPGVCWMVFLMYRAYSVSCNIKGGKAVGTFIPGLVLAEILSKVGIYYLLKLV